MGSLVFVLVNIHIAKLASGFPLEDLRPVNTVAGIYSSQREGINQLSVSLWVEE